MADSEATILAKCLLAGGSCNAPFTRIWRNTVGTGLLGFKVLREEGPIKVITGGRMVDFGLGTGSADIVGIQSRTVTQADVGKTIGVFVSAEVKTLTGTLSDDQIKWKALMDRAGAVAGTVRSDIDMRKLLGIA